MRLARSRSGARALLGDERKADRGFGECPAGLRHRRSLHRRRAGEGAKMGAGGKRSERREGERGRKAQQRAIHSTRDD